jgi:UDP-glucose 4-epimerase
MASYLVTGGAGFIGSHLVDALLNEGHSVIVIDNLSSGKRENLSPKAELIIGDICDRQLVLDTLTKVDGCFHLAAQLGIQIAKDQWLETNKNNLVGTIAIFDAVSELKEKQHKDIPIVYTSSCAIYGDATELPLPEDILTFPTSGYGADKLACELHGFVAAKVHGLKTVGLRLFNIYGPRQDPHAGEAALIPSLIEKIQNNQAIDIFGNGEQSRDFVHVNDVVRHFIFFMNNIEKSSPNVYNVCTGQSISVMDLIEAISKSLNRDLEVDHHPARVGDVLHSRGNPDKAKQLGIAAKVSLEQGLNELLSIADLK